MTRGAIFILGALLAGGCAASSQDRRPAPADWPTAVRDFASPAEAVRVSALFPNSAGMQRRRLMAALQTRNASEAAAALRRLASMGAVLSEPVQAQSAELLGPEAMAPIAAQFAANSVPVAASRIYASIPAEHDLVEGIAWNGSNRRLYATTVVDRALLSLEAGRTSVAAPAGPGSLFGAAYDPDRDRLWVASASVAQTPKVDFPFVGLLVFDPDRPGEPRRIPAPAGMTAAPGDVAIARDGTVYASDGLNGALYRCPPGCSELEVLLPPGSLFSAQGLALSPDQERLYIADRRYGIAILQRSGGRLLRLTGDDGTMLDGIDGLAAHGPNLIAIQTAYAPARIVRLRLSADGLRVERLDVLERAHPDWGEITLGTVAGGRLLYVGNAQWERYGESGAAIAGKPALPTPIRVLDLP